MRRTIETKADKAAGRAGLTIDELNAFLDALASASAPNTADLTARVTIAGHVKSIAAVWDVEDAPALELAEAGTR